MVAGLIFGLAYLFAGITFGGWLLQHSAFDPGRTQDLAPIVLDNGSIRAQVINTIADATASQLGMSSSEARAYITNVAETPGGAALFGELLHPSAAPSGWE